MQPVTKKARKPGSGGPRPGSGRKPAPLVLPASADSPLEFLIGVMNDIAQHPALRVRAAVAAAQYKHTKTHDGGKKDAKESAAKTAGAGKFATGASPRLVSSR